MSDLIGSRRREAAVPPPPPRLRDLQIATAALLLEVSGADHDRGKREKKAILRSLQTAFGLDEAETVDVVAAADRRTGDAVSIYEFSHLVDRSFRADQKALVIELAFRVAFADERLAGEEEHLIRRLATLLHVSHDAFIAAKLRARAP